MLGEAPPVGMEMGRGRFFYDLRKVDGTLPFGWKQPRTPQPLLSHFTLQAAASGPQSNNAVPRDTLR